VSERKRADDEIRALNGRLERHATQLQAANTELEAFSYSVSHDLRAPLRSIDGFSMALLEDHAQSLDADGRDYLRRVRAATQRMSQLIDDILNLARVSRAQMTRATVDLSEMARAVVAELQKTEPDRQVEIDITGGLSIEGDAHLLRVVLDNLLANAWKFTSKQKQARIEFGSAGANGSRAFYVRDNGAGFDMTYASKLFGAFQRLHGTGEFPGTGVGLATVQRIINRHGGRIWAEAEVDKGAIFRFTL
jgi:light-regulated signal transduction histidine kinase (bacteriophytochrome)